MNPSQNDMPHDHMHSTKYLVLELQERIKLLLQGPQLLLLDTHPSYDQASELLHMFCEAASKSIHHFLVLHLELLLPFCSEVTQHSSYRHI